MTRQPSSIVILWLAGVLSAALYGFAAGLALWSSFVPVGVGLGTAVTGLAQGFGWNALGGLIGVLVMALLACLAGAEMLQVPRPDAYPS